MFKLFKMAKDAFLLQLGYQQRDAASNTDQRRTRTEASRVEKIKAICALGKMHARSMRDGCLGHPELLGTERKSYEMYKREATASARRVTDPVLRDRSVGHIIDLCVDAGEEDHARALLSVVQSEFVRREIAEKHPQLRLFVAIDQRRRSG
jgi:hypothetical protein